MKKNPAAPELATKAQGATPPSDDYGHPPAEPIAPAPDCHAAAGNAYTLSRAQAAL